MLNHLASRRLGFRIFGAASILFGLAGLIWGDFATNWQPVPIETPLRGLLAYLSATLLFIGGVAIQFRRTARIGAILAAIPYVAFTLLWTRRVIGFPQIFGTWAGCAEQFVLVVAALMVYAIRAKTETVTSVRLTQVCRYLVALCAVIFGIQHFSAFKQTAAMIPGWLPPSQPFWAIATGVAFILAGLAILFDVLAPLAAWMLTAMFVCFHLFLWIPRAISSPQAHNVWGANAMNLGAMAAAWMVADWISNQRLAPAADIGSRAATR